MLLDIDKEQLLADYDAKFTGGMSLARKSAIRQFIAWLEEQSFTPWNGGSNPPDDWDGENVLFANGATGKATKNYVGWEDSPGFDIIGYKRKKSC